MHEICKYAPKPENMHKYAKLFACFWNPYVMIGGNLNLVQITTQRNMHLHKIRALLICNRKQSLDFFNQSINRFLFEMAYAQSIEFSVTGFTRNTYL